MAQSVSIVISSTTPKVSISITENSRNLFAYVGSGNGLVFIPSETSLDLTQAASTVAIQTETAGISAQFTYAQITTFTIDGADQLPTATNLSLVIDACAPFFFDSVNGFGVRGIDYTLVAGDTTIDYALCRGASVVYLKTSEVAPTTWSISKITNVPEGKLVMFMILFQEPNLTNVTFVNTSPMANINADGQIARSGANILIESKNEWINIQGFNNGTYDLVTISASGTNNA